MRKIALALSAIFILATVPAAYALSLNGLFSWVPSLGPAEAAAPTIISALASPEKVVPGQQLEILVAFEDSHGIESANAVFHHDAGSDTVDMVLISGTRRKGTYLASWKVHNTKGPEWYTTDVKLTNSVGKSATATVRWQDPTVGHDLDELDPGQSQDGGETGFNFYTSSSSSGVYAVAGISTAPSGEVYGIYSESKSTTGYAAELMGGQGLYVDEDLNVTGTLLADCSITTSTTVWIGREVRATCPTGKCAVGGGCDSASPNYLQQSRLYQASGNCYRYWNCQGQNSGAGITAYAICC
jgi:hypothetical protein